MEITVKSKNLFRNMTIIFLGKRKFSYVISWRNTGLEDKFAIDFVATSEKSTPAVSLKVSCDGPSRYSSIKINKKFLRIDAVPLMEDFEFKRIKISENFYFNHTKKHDFDIVVLGSGIAGIIAALELEELGAKVLVVEAGKYKRNQVRSTFNRTTSNK